MARRPQTPHALALSHFMAARISRDEYQMVVTGRAFVQKGYIWIHSGRGWCEIRLVGRKV